MVSTSSLRLSWPALDHSWRYFSEPEGGRNKTSVLSSVRPELPGLLSQIPGGELLDVTRSKRLLVGAGTLMLAGGALIIAIRPDFLLVFAALVLQGATAGFLGPGIIAISLGIVGRSELAERLGRNQRFKSTGSLLQQPSWVRSDIFCRIG